MKYIISSCGFDIAVGLLDANTATEDINLANNILGTNHNDNYYNGVIIFNNMKHFYRFLINKYYIRYWQPNKSFSQVLKKASNKTRQIINNEVKYESFMVQIYSHQTTSHIYKYQPQK